MIGKKIVAIAILSGIVCAFGLASEKRVQPVLIIHPDGKEELKIFADSKKVDDFKKNTLPKAYREEMERWKENGKKGPKPIKHLVIKLKAATEAEVGTESYKKMVEEEKKKNVKKIDEIKENAKQRMAAALGLDGKDGGGASETRLKPRTNAERNIPAKYTMAFYHKNVVYKYTGAVKVKFWAAAEPGTGKPLRAVILLKNCFLGPTDTLTEDITKTLAERGKTKPHQENKTFLYYDDPYAVEIVADGKWREYEVAVEWELIRAINFRASHAQELHVCVADPGTYYFDDFSIVGDQKRMPVADVAEIFKQLEKEAAEKDDGDKTPKKTAKGSGEIPVATFMNGDLNSRFDEFLNQWARDENENAPIKAVRMDGRRGQKVEGEKDKKDKKDGNDEENFHLVNEYYVKVDATAFK